MCFVPQAQCSLFSGEYHSACRTRYGVEQYFIKEIMRSETFRTFDPIQANMFLIPVMPCRGMCSVVHRQDKAWITRTALLESTNWPCSCCCLSSTKTFAPAAAKFEKYTPKLSKDENHERGKNHSQVFISAIYREAVGICPWLRTVSAYLASCTYVQQQPRCLCMSQEYVTAAVNYISTRFGYYNGSRPHLSQYGRDRLPPGRDHFWFSTHDGGATRGKENESIVLAAACCEGP
jgi:hypothetical protein